MAVYLTHTPAGTSTWNIIHWCQMYVSKKLQKYQYDTVEENRKHYGQVILYLINKQIDLMLANH